MNFPIQLLSEINFRCNMNCFCAKNICRVCETYISIYIENSRIFCMVLCGFTAAIFIRRIVEERREIEGVVCEVTSTTTLPHFWGDNIVRGGNIYLTIYILKPSGRQEWQQSEPEEEQKCWGISQGLVRPSMCINYC